jgi:hypothetical protein
VERITITIETGNAAFEDSPTGEIARILRHLAKRFEEHGDLDGAKIMDHFGNSVGTVRIEAL